MRNNWTYLFTMTLNGETRSVITPIKNIFAHFYAKLRKDLYATD